jgi:hypothetical protein
MVMADCLRCRSSRAAWLWLCDMPSSSTLTPEVSRIDEIANCISSNDDCGNWLTGLAIIFGLPPDNAPCFR